MPAKSCFAGEGDAGHVEFGNGDPKDRQADMIVNPTTCDQKKKASVMMEGMGYSVYDLELPSAKRAKHRAFTGSARCASSRTSARVDGRTLTTQKPERAMAKTGRAQARFEPCIISAAKRLL